jgi:hypothetical protein
MGIGFGDITDGLRKAGGKIADTATESLSDAGNLAVIGLINAKEKLGSIDILPSLSFSGQRDHGEPDLGMDATYYPEPAQQPGEVARISDLLKKKPLSGEGAEIVQDLHKLGVNDVDIWHGSYIAVTGRDGKGGDGGELYKKWAALDGASKRGSSHESSAQQYQIAMGPGDSVILFGKTPEGNTWFQLERHKAINMDEIGDIPDQIKGRVLANAGKWLHGDFTLDDAHGRDKALYDKIHQNIGPFGVSPYSEANPIRIAFK